MSDKTLTFGSPSEYLPVVGEENNGGDTDDEDDDGTGTENESPDKLGSLYQDSDSESTRSGGGGDKDKRPGVAAAVKTTAAAAAESEAATKTETLAKDTATTAAVEAKGPAMPISAKGLVVPDDEEKERIRTARANCCKNCCPERHDSTSRPFHMTHCYRCCCLPCRCCLVEAQIIHCQKAYIILVHAVLLALLVTTIMFAIRVWHLPASGPTYLTIDYVATVQSVNVSVSNTTSRVYIAYITPFAIAVRSSSDDPPCQLAPSGDPIVFRLSYDPNGTHLYIQTEGATGVRLARSAYEWGWVSNATASNSGNVPSGGDILESLDSNELVKLL